MNCSMRLFEVETKNLAVCTLKASDIPAVDD